MNRAEGRNQKKAGPLHQHHKEAFSPEKGLCSAPFCIDSKTGIASKVRARLYEERLSRQFNGGDISRRTGCECDLAWSIASGKSRDESRFSAGSSFDCAQQTAFQLRLKFNISRHRHHSTGFRLDRLLRLELKHRQRE